MDAKNRTSQTKTLHFNIQVATKAVKSIMSGPYDAIVGTLNVRRALPAHLRRLRNWLKGKRKKSVEIVENDGDSFAKRVRRENVENVPGKGVIAKMLRDSTVRG